VIESAVRPPDATEGLALGTRAQLVAERLQLDIMNGGYPPGSHLRQSEIAKRYGVSTTPVREAFAHLQSLGLVRIVAHRGAVVFVPTLEELEEVYEIREALEALATRRAVRNLDDDDIRRLEEQYRRMVASTEREDWAHEHREFHRVIYDKANRPQVLALIESLRGPYGAFATPFDFGTNRRIEIEHEKILKACKARDAEAAVRAVKHHLRVALEDARKHLEATLDERASSNAPPSD
jgi:DNA-binding GntR family transcriptional regulator